MLLIVKRHKIAHLILYRTNQTVQLDRRYFLFSKRVVEIFFFDHVATDYKSLLTDRLIVELEFPFGSNSGWLISNTESKWSHHVTHVINTFIISTEELKFTKKK